MAAPKRNKMQRMVDIQLIAEWAIKGWTIYMMQQALAKVRDYTLSRTAIFKDIKRAEACWSEEVAHMRDQAKRRLLAEINTVRAEAWRMLDASKMHSTKERAELEPGAEINLEVDGGRQGASREATRTERMLTLVRETHTQSGDPALLSIILACNKREAELMGLDAPKQLRTDVAVAPAIREPEVMLYLPHKEPLPETVVDTTEVKPNEPPPDTAPAS